MLSASASSSSLVSAPSSIPESAKAGSEAATEGVAEKETKTKDTGAGSGNAAYLPPPVEEHIKECSHSARPLSAAKLARLAKAFADAIPDEEFSVASLQGCKSCRTSL